MSWNSFGRVLRFTTWGESHGPALGAVIDGCPPGLTLGEGVTIDLQSEVVRTMEPPTEVSYVFNPELPYGTNKITVKPRTGYVVETYKVWYKNGKETGREMLHTSTYRAYQQVVEYNN